MFSIETSEYMIDWDSQSRLLRVLHIESGIVVTLDDRKVEQCVDGERLVQFLCSPRKANALAAILFEAGTDPR